MLKKERCKFGRLMTVGLAVFAVAVGAAHGAAYDEAGNYTSPPNTFTNGANRGTGFEPWQLSLNGSSVAELRDSTEGTGDINSTNDLSFCLYGDTGGNFADAIRPFPALSAGDTVSFVMAYNWNGGTRGMSLLRAGGELMYINYGGDNQLAYGFAGGSYTVLTSNYLSDAVLEVSITQLANNQLDVTLTRSDAWTTNLVSGNLGFAANGLKFYNGGHAGDNIEYALFVNDLEIVDGGESILTLTGHEGMPAPWTNQLVVTRNGATDNPLDVDLSSSDTDVATVPASVTIPAGTNAVSVNIVGVGYGEADIEATATGFSTGLFYVAVFDVAYDDSSYYGGAWPDVSNEGMGFGAWIYNNNDGPGDGFTNYAGRFIGSSTASGGGDVNASPSGDAFGLYANQQGSGGDPTSEATRPFDQALAEGDTVSVDFGVNYRNGAKGVMFQNGGTWIFEVATIGDNYVYQNHGGGGSQVILGGSWTNYAADTAIRVELSRKSGTVYDVSIIRSGGISETTVLSDMDLGGAPDRARFYVFNTEPGGENNLFFNRLAIWSGEVTPILGADGREGMVVDQTNLLVIGRSGPTDEQLVVNLVSDDTGVLTVPASVTINVGEASAMAEVVGVGRGEATVTASATGFSDLEFGIEVFNLAYDSTSYYEVDSWTNGSNGGIGYQAWVLSNNAGDGDGYTNYAGAFMGDSTSGGGGDVNAADDEAFGLYANQEGSGGDPLSEATRPFGGIFGTMQIGQQFVVDFGVNYRNGSKGLVFQNGNDWLFEIAVTGDDYVYQNHGAGWPQTSFNWTYAADTSFNVELTRVGPLTFDIRVTRTSGGPNFMYFQAIPLGGIPDRVRFYSYNTEAGDENNLYFNSMGMNEYGALVMEGVVNIDIGGENTIYIERFGDTSEELQVKLASAGGTVVSVPTSVVFAAGQSVTQFVATGVSEALVQITTEAAGYVGAPLLMNAFDFPDEFDNAGNYIPGVIVDPTFTNGANGGAGFGPWQFSEPTGGGFIALRDSREGNEWMNSMNDRSFGFLGGSEGSYASAYRDFNTALADGDRFDVLVGMNWSGGNRGVDLQDASGNKLFNFNLGDGDVYAYSFGTNDPVDLGWAYSSTSLVQVVAEQLTDDQLRVTLTRLGGATATATSTDLENPVGRVNFYNGGHDVSDTRLALFANDLEITRGGMTDNIPNWWWDQYSIPVESRVAGGDYDGDMSSNMTEYVADTDPTDDTSFYPNQIVAGDEPGATMQLQAGPPTSANRLYDVWYTESLSGGTWTALSLDVPGIDENTAVTMTVTNTPDLRYYRTGVKVP